MIRIAAAEVVADIAKYTDVKPMIQIGEVVSIDV